MSIIASDSYDLKPYYFDTIISNAGERYDFVVSTNNTEGDYWIRVRGMGVCAILPTESFALLRYVSNEVNMESDDEHPLPPMPLYNETYVSGVVSIRILFMESRIKNGGMHLISTSIVDLNISKKSFGKFFS